MAIIPGPPGRVSLHRRPSTLEEIREVLAKGFGPRRPNGRKVLDLYCGPGGAGVGYWLAGFDVTGVDLHSQPRYPFVFRQADALDVLQDREFLAEFDAIHASPTCQRKARVTAWRGRREDHPDTLTPTLRLLSAQPLPYVVENVTEAVTDGTLRADYLLCGTQFGLKVRRHRAFQIGNWTPPFELLPRCYCYRLPGLVPFEHKDERAFADAMGCTWMGKDAARQAIPPAFTHHIGTQFLRYLGEHATVGAAACNETPSCQAPGCTRPLRQPSTGRRRRYCSGACRVRAHRRLTENRP